MQQRTRRAAAWQVRNRAQCFLSGAEEKNGTPGRFPRQGCGLPDGRDGTSDDAGNKRREPTPGEKQPSPQRTTQQRREKVAGNGRRTGKETTDSAENGQRRRKQPQPGPRIRDAAATLSATRRKTHIPRTSPSPKKYEAGAGTMWGGPASGFRAFSPKDVSTLPRKVRGIPKLKRSRDAPRTIPETSDANRPGMSTTVAAGNGKVAGHKRGQERNSRRRNGQHNREQTPRPRAAHPAMFRRIHPALCQTNTTRPALPPPETGHASCPAHKKRRSAKPKFCRTPDRHDSGLARSLNRTFSYRMKLVRMTGSFSGSGTPAALPASKQRSIHAMFLAS